MKAGVVLAAGKGTRFRSELAKVLHVAAGRTMLRWVLDALAPLGLDRIVVVVGHQAEAVAAEAKAAGLTGLVTVVQEPQNGTGHAVRMVAEAGHLEGCHDVLVVPGDAPLLDTRDLEAVLTARDGAGVALLSAVVVDPTGYGRIVRDDTGAVRGVVEERDATPSQRDITEVNTSVYAFDGSRLPDALASLSTDNAQGEEYLTDCVELLAPNGAVAVVAADPVSTGGCNDRAQLAAAAAVLRHRILTDLMQAGVTVVDPSTTYVEADVEVAADATLLPGVHLEGATCIEAGAVIGPDSRLVDTEVAAGATVTYSVLLSAVIGPRATVGPFTYLRPGTMLGEGAKAGAYVEMKNADVRAGAKVPHLSYVGDAEVGEGANVGAATVTVNYDGFEKHRTVIGANARIGSDTMLVAPVTVGEGAYTGAGSVITADVPDGALAVERTDQRTIPGYAERRAARAARKTARSPSSDAVDSEGSS